MLPNEADLSTRFGVSRSTVREALRLLGSKGFVTTSRGVRGGSVVREPGHDDVSGMLSMAIGLLARADHITVGDVLEARELLEVPSARLAAVRWRPGDLASLAAFLEPDLEDPEHSAGPASFDQNSSFHKSILEATGNRLLRTMAEPLFTTIQTRFARELATPEFWHQVTLEHKGIYDAIERRDAERAGQAMALHLARLRGTYEQIDRSRSGSSAGPD
jgi:GntR family transcriptional regulator, transcriptional repressor for pyruvate dehydrogenase complex